MKYGIIYLLLISFTLIQCKKSNDTYTTDTHDNYNYNENPGSSAKDLLRSRTYKSLKIELQYMPGQKPDLNSINIFVDLLYQKLDKPGGIIVVEKEINPSVKTIFTPDDILDIESRNRTVYTSGDQMAAYILFIDGSYYDKKTIALSYKNTSICFFGEQLKYILSGTTEDKIKVVSLLLSHEFGHLLGLVNLGSPMLVDHHDHDHGNHCNNAKCIMYYTYASSEKTEWDFAPILLEPPTFDKNCSDDLKANGGK